jgi:hypothetical protein
MAATKTARDIFLDALDLAPADRAAYLDEACGDEAAVRQRVEALLRANDDPGAFLSKAKPGVGHAALRNQVEAAPLPPAEAGDGTSAHVPDRLAQTEDHGDPTARVGSILGGKYKLIEAIGEGGMGGVYMAQQTEPVNRAVAVKVIKAGMDSKAVLARFDYRGGHFADADTVLAAAMTEGEGNPYILGTGAFYRAMSLFRQGKRGEARQLATAAAATMKPLPKDEKDPLADKAKHDDLILWLAYKEAKELIGFDATPAAASRKNPSPPRAKK